MTGPPPIACPHCGRAAACHGIDAPAAPPAVGDVSVCWYCCGVAVFDSPATLRRPTRAELAALMAAPSLQRTLAAAALAVSPAQAVALARELQR
jgi:hypothetical protein